MDDATFTATIDTLVAKLRALPPPAANISQTQYLHSIDLGYELNTESGYSKLYNLENDIVFESGPKSISIKFMDKDGKQLGLNNVGFSWDNNRKMYVLGVKMSGPGPKISGTAAITHLKHIAHAMKIDALYLHDAAGIECYTSPRGRPIEIKHFSILRVIVGKPTFYEAFGGVFNHPDNAARAKELLQTEISDKDKATCLAYMQALGKTPKPEDESLCTNINRIIQESLVKLQKRGLDNALLEFIIIIPQKGGGKLRKKAKRTRRRRRFLI